MASPSDGGRVQRATARMYARLGSRIAYLVLAGTFVAGLATGLVASVWSIRYLGLSSSEWLHLMAFCVPLGVGAIFLGIYLLRRPFRLILSWSGDDRTPERAPEVWTTTVRLPYLVITRGAVIASITLVPIVIVLIRVADAPVYSAVAIFVAGVVALGAGLLLIAFCIELVMRPMVEDVAAHLPEGFEPGADTWRLRTKAFAPLPVVTFFAALTVGGFVDLADSGALRLTLVIAIALVTVAAAGLVFLVITRSTLDPLDDLLAATRRVRGGDITTKVPVVTADDLGLLAESFNRMLEDLRRHEDELRASRARVVAAAADERRRVERDLHDGAQQHLVVLGLKLGMVERSAAADPQAVGPLIEELRADLDHALGELRDLAHGIYPPLLDNEGLPGALGEAVQRAAIPATLECDGAGRYPREIEAAVYFCCLEALQNAAKHAGEGARATVELGERDGALRFAIVDDGRGFDPAAVDGSAGVQNMADRIGALGGGLEVSSAPGQGTRVCGTVPLSRVTNRGSHE